MQSDYFLVFGLIVAAFAIPAAVSAFSDSRPPRSAAIALMIGGAMLLIAFLGKPSGYAPAQIPDTFARVFADIIK
ncbi:hypothetical protein [Albirhodobacter sp. R86504]|jgi:hypothetical protein|uniref:hypothetical protein n=1 Tax=Albirhodobacter sp. R86504 TaxID=3093848 RepID=UPI00366FE8EE